jgi:hypothetical protein
MKILRALTTKDEPLSSIRSIAASNNLNAAIGNITGANFLTGLLLLMGADDAMIGIVTAVGLAGNLLQIFSPILLERFKKRKSLLIWGRILLYSFNIAAIGLIPFLPTENKLKLLMVIAVIGIVNMINALTAPGIQVFQITNIPQMMRAKFFSYYQLTNGIFVFTIALGGGAIVDYFKKTGNELVGFEILRMAALVFAVIDIILFMSKIKEHPIEIHHEPITFKSIFVAPFKDKLYMKSVLAACAWNFPANINGYFFIAYLLNDLSVKYSYLTAVDLLNIPILILFTGMWKNIIVRYSYLRSLAIALGVCVVHLICMSFITAGTLFLFPFVMSMFFLITPAINVVMANLPYENLPRTNQTNYIGFFSTATNLAALLGILAGKEFLRQTSGKIMVIAGFTFVSKQMLMLFNAGAMFLCTLFVLYLVYDKYHRKIRKTAADDSAGGLI